MLETGPGNRGRRLIKRIGGYDAVLYEFALAALVRAKQAQGMTLVQIADELDRMDVWSYRGRLLSPMNSARSLSASAATSGTKE